MDNTLQPASNVSKDLPELNFCFKLILPEMTVYDHGLSPFPMQNSYSKSILDIKSLFVNRFSIFLLHILRVVVPDIVGKIFCLPFN